jgi:hypothetical protein
MPPKAKKGKKKEEGPVLTPEEEKEVEETELGKFEADVRQKTADLKAIQRERNYMQVERVGRVGVGARARGEGCGVRGVGGRATDRCGARRTPYLGSWTFAGGR